MTVRVITNWPPSVFRVYERAGKDGYPPEWHRRPMEDVGLEDVGFVRPGIKDLVREEAGHRCVRCGHPYRKGEHGKGEWTPCDERCTHNGPVQLRGIAHCDGGEITTEVVTEAQWRILTVHHLNGNKLDCRWWNLASLCQRCHLTIQGRVVMARVWPWEHTEWFRPYVAGYYASVYLGEELTREETVARLDELLALERAGGTTTDAQRPCPEPAPGVPAGGGTDG